MKNYLIHLIIKEKKLIIAALGVSVLVFVVSLLNPANAIYQSSAKLFIKNIPQQSIISDVSGVSLIQSESGYSNPLFNFVEVLSSRRISDRVFSKLSAQNSKDLKVLNIKDEGKWHSYFENLIKTKIIPSTDTIEVSLKWNNQKTADKVLSSLIDEFKSENIEMRKSVALNQKNHLQQNLNQISNDLADVRQQIRNYVVNNNIVDVDVEKTTLVRARVELEKDIELLKSRIKYFDKKHNELASQIGIAEVPVALRATSVGSDPYLNDLFGNLADVQQKYANLSATFTENYPRVISAKNEMMTLSNVISQRTKEFFNELPVSRGIYDEPSQEIVAEMSNAKAEKISLLSQLYEMQRGVQHLIKRENELPEKIAGLEVLTKQEDALKVAYDNIKRKVLDAQVKESETVDNIIVLNKPSKPVVLMTGLLVNFMGILYLGLLVGILAAWVKNSSSNKEHFDRFVMSSINPVNDLNKQDVMDKDSYSVNKS